MMVLVVIACLAWGPCERFEFAIEAPSPLACMMIAPLALPHLMARHPGYRVRRVEYRPPGIDT
jgi:hypothetical protein